ncbi:MAG TPA: hypothetical protein DCZ75_17705 [Geobacter sp.]|nr:hypothetical protein [Geobacter sp.]
MTDKNLSHKSLLVLVTCVTTICIAFMGMRVPDLSRPHRPKPKPRAYIEQQLKKSQQAQAKKCLEVQHAAVLPVAAELAAPVIHVTAPPFAFQGAAFRPLFPNGSRAPPAFHV